MVQTRVTRCGAKLQPVGPGCPDAKWVTATMAAGTHWRVPATAVIFNAQGTRVAIVGTGDKLHFQDVVLGRDFGTTIDIQGGLRGDETIVKQPTVSFQEGQVVTPVASPKSSGG